MDTLERQASSILLREDRGAVAILTLNRPEKLNAHNTDGSIEFNVVQRIHYSSEKLLARCCRLPWSRGAAVGRFHRREKDQRLSPGSRQRRHHADPGGAYPGGAHGRAWRGRGGLRGSGHPAHLGARGRYRETLSVSAPDQVLVSGLLANGAPLSIHYRGGTARDGDGLFWEINGTEGDIRVSAPSRGHTQLVPLSLKGARGDEKTQ